MNPRARPLIRLLARQLVEDFYAGRLPAEPVASAHAAPAAPVTRKPKRAAKARAAK